jgi:hypothetical protein
VRGAFHGPRLGNGLGVEFGRDGPDVTGGLGGGLPGGLGGSSLEARYLTPLERDEGRVPATDFGDDVVLEVLFVVAHELDDV